MTDEDFAKVLLQILEQTSFVWSQRGIIVQVQERLEELKTGKRITTLTDDGK